MASKRVDMTGIRGLSVISSSSHTSDWDGDIIPHIVAASQTDKIFATSWYMKKEAYAESTIHAVGKRLAYLAKNCLLDISEVVKGFVAEKDCSNAFKESLVEAYDLYCRANNIVWKKPFYERYDKMPKIPTEEKLNMIIARASKSFALILSMMKDLGARPIELTWLKVKDVDLETGAVRMINCFQSIRVLFQRATDGYATGWLTI